MNLKAAKLQKGMSDLVNFAFVFLDSIAKAWNELIFTVEKMSFIADDELSIRQTLVATHVSIFWLNFSTRNKN